MNMSWFGITTLLSKPNYMFKVEECELIWCNHLVTGTELYVWKLRNMSWFGVTTSLPELNYMFQAEEYELIWCNDLMATRNKLHILQMQEYQLFHCQRWDRLVFFSNRTESSRKIFKPNRTEPILFLKISNQTEPNRVQAKLSLWQVYQSTSVL